jgi:hypothetical protein
MATSFDGTPIPGTPEAAMADWKRDIERRLRSLEAGSAPLSSSSMRGGTMRYLADDSTEMAVFGDFGAEGIDVFKGFLMRDSEEVTVMATRSDQKGLVKPIMQGQFVLANQTIGVTSAGFSIAAYYTPLEVYHEVLRVVIAVDTPAATTAEVRIVEAVSLRSTDILTTVADTTNLLYFEWVHEVPKGDLGRFQAQFQIHARRASGAGTIQVHQPDEVAWACQFDVPLADTNGHVSII